MAKFKISFTVGALLRSTVRKALEKFKVKISYEEPKAQISILETKSFLESQFIFSATELSDTLAISASEGLKNYLKKLEDE